MRLLVTRPERPAVRTAERLRAMGHEPVCEPLLSLRFAPPARLLGAMVPDGVILTSANAARAIASHQDLARLVPLKLWTVGERTSRAARELGFGNLQSEAPDLVRLAGLLLKTAPALNLLHIAGEDRAGDLGAMIAGAGHEVETLVVYKADQEDAISAETKRALEAGEIDAVLHYSGRTAAAYLRLTEPFLAADRAPPSHICLSEAVAAPLRKRGADVHVATDPDENALMACLQGVAAARQAADATLDNLRASTTRNSMSDPDTPRPDNADEPRRAKKPRPAVLDLKATEIDAPKTGPLEVATPGIDTPPEENAALEPAASVDDPKDIEAIPPVESGAPDASGASESPAASQAESQPEPEPLPASEPAAVEVPASDAEPRTSLGSLIGAGVAGAAIAIVAFLLLVTSELIPLTSADNPALGSRIAAVENEVRTLAARPQQDGDGARLDELAANLQSLRAQVEALPVAAPAAPENAAPQEDGRVAALQQQLADLSSRLQALADAPAQPDRSEAAIAGLVGRVDQLAARVEAPREPDPAIAQANDQAQQAANQAQQAVQQAGEAANVAKEAGDRAAQASEGATRAIAEAKRLSVLASIASLENAIMRGAPYAGALQNARERLPESVVATLQVNAEGGLPTLDVLGAALNGALEAAPRPQVAPGGGFVDRFVEGARGLVRVRPADGSAQEVQGDDAWAVRTRVQSRLERRAYAEALQEWDALDQAAKDATQRQAEDLRRRLAVDQALDSVRSEALRAAETEQ
ncbi:uroporphyrinogen-III synthase [Terrihabitans sp. B22-R8]|uniref:uroporphyrinogen-III synthase n=1 Tax=Terrihabitans sp. B22-R8 TaxID=3425128 RepID=UPI00403D09C9